MTNKDLRKELARMKKETDKLEKQFLKSELSDKLACITDIIMQDKYLQESLSSMPSDEIKIIMNAVIGSTAFQTMVHTEMNNNQKLKELRAKKAEKAEKRKHKSENANPPLRPEDFFDC